MSIGKISEFKVQTDDWQLYIERLQQYFLVNKIEANMQVPTLITLMGAEGYELLVNLCTPAKPHEKTFGYITEIMAKHLQPKPSELAERYKFRHRKQNGGESISEYVAVLKKMSKTCGFEAWLEDSLRDQLVCGIRSEVIRQRLFAENDLDFGKAYKLAASMEAAEKDASAVMAERDGRPSTTADCQAMAGAWRGRAESAHRGRGYNGGVGTGAGQRRIGTGPDTQVTSSTASTLRQFKGCSTCGGNHITGSCKYARYVCRVCNQQGHLKKMCPNNIIKHNYLDKHEKEPSLVDSDQSNEVIFVNNYQLALSKCTPYKIKLNVNGKDFWMECDTGSAVSCISRETYEENFRDLKMQKCNIGLKYYTGEIIRPLGVVSPWVVYKNRSDVLDLYVIPNGQSMLLGRQWIASLNIELPKLIDEHIAVNMLNPHNFDIKDFSSRFSKVFEDGLGRFTGGTVGIHIREDAQPRFLRARPLAYAMRAPVERALADLVRDGVLTPVERSEWATPIVPVVKKDGNIRICADYKLTLNKVLEVDRYPLPRVDDLLIKLEGGERYTNIDLSQAYAQLVLDESKKLTVINTHKGLFMYNRLVYGLSSSPGIFQRRLEQMFADMPKVGVFLDDIIITGRNSQEHINNLYTVFERLEKYGLRVKKEKCEFFSKSVTYLGYVISKEGIHTSPEKVKAIVNIPTPQNVSELRSFIGMLMYYAKFIKDISTILSPLYNLLKLGVKYEWSATCQAAFERVKECLSSSDLLIHYSQELPLVLTVDASAVGVSAILSHNTPAGERPVAYASRTLSVAEKAYSQIDREALAIIFGIRKFHQYVYGRKFTLRTDHKPLTYIFGDKVGIPVMAASRLQRWAVLLSGYDYTIEYVASKSNCADALSRLPAKTTKELESKKEITYVNFVENFLPVRNEEVKKATMKDVELSRVILYVQSGWPARCPSNELEPYFKRRNELYCEAGCIMWGYRIVVPSLLRQAILKQLHVGHLGIVKSKMMARSYVWWPGIDTDLQRTCQECESCALEADAPPRHTPQSWPYHTKPWSRLHMDFLGPFRGKTYLVIIDSSSKWLEISEMNNTNALVVIKVLRSLFARFGLPVEVVSDQGPPFTSRELADFLQLNGIRQLFSPVYHPQSNGAAENAVKLCKRAIKKAMHDKVEIDTALQAFLFAYRNTAHCTTGESPAMLLQRRSLRSRFDLLRSEQTVGDRVFSAQNRQVQNAGGVQRSFDIEEPVWARAYGSQNKWQKQTVVARKGSRRYVLDNGEDQLIERHTDQIRHRSRLSDVTVPNEVSELCPRQSRDEDKTSVTETNNDIGPEGVVLGEGGMDSHESITRPATPRVEVDPVPPVERSLRPRPCRPPIRYE